MWRNYLVVALRGLWRGRLYSFVNIAGLAVGFAACLLIFSYVRQELGYDKWIPGYAQLYSVETTFALAPGNRFKVPSAPNPAKAAFVEGIPEVVDATRFALTKRVPLKERTPVRLRVYEADANYFDLIPMRFLAGDPSSALTRPDALVLTASAARQLTGGEDAVGRTVDFADGDSRVVTAVVADPPPETSFPVAALVPIDDTALGPAAMTWGYVRRQLLLKLAPGADPRNVERQMAEIARPHLKTVFQGRPADAGDPMIFDLMPLADIHLKSASLGNDGHPANTIETIVAFAIIGLIILGLAAFNYTNILLARSLSRAREVALRKILGARRRTLVTQFLAESLLLTLLSLAIGAGLAALLVPHVGTIFGTDVRLGLLQHPRTLVLTVLVSLFAGIAGGIYPALVASGYRPARLLHGRGPQSGRGGHLKSVLVLLQFGAAIGLAASAMVIARQIDFARESALGFEDDAVYLVTEFEKEESARLPALEARIRTLPGVVATAWGTNSPGDRTIIKSTMPPVGGGDPVGVELSFVTPDYFRVLGVTPLYGRVFSPAHPEDLRRGERGERSGGVVINETAARRLGFATPADAVGSDIGERKQWHVVGVIPDLRQRSVREPVAPTVFYADDETLLGEWAVQQLLVRFAPQHVTGAREAIAAAVADLFPDRPRPLRILPLDQQLAALYAQESQRVTALATAAGLAVFIAGLGLFGLAAIAAERRTREIGVRKVFGARMRDILALATAEFTKPVIAANLVAWPVAYYFMRRWLDGFAYRIELAPWPFLAAGAGALLVALLTVSGHALAVARTHPAIALREE